MLNKQIINNAMVLNYGRYLQLVLLLLMFSADIFAQAPSISYQTPQVYAVNSSISPLAPKNKGGAVPATIYGQVTTFAGGPSSGNVFSGPTRIGEDVNGNVYVADRDNNQIKRVTPAGVVTVFASGFNQPNGVAVDKNGNVYVADAASNAIRKVTPAGVVTTFAGGNMGSVNGTGTNAGFYYPYAVALDAAGDVYVADNDNNLVRKITPAAVVTTLAGNGAAGYANGQGVAASFNNPNCVNTDAAGNIYVSDQQNNRIRKITPGGLVTTVAGNSVTGAFNGNGTGATFNSPSGVAADAIGNIYVADLGNNLIRKIDVQNNVTTIAGYAAGYVDGIATAASFYHPNDVQVDPNGFLLVDDYGNNAIRKVIITGYTIDKTLPPGLIFDPTTGIISGTPTATSPATNYTVTAYNIAGSSSTIVNIAVTVTAPPSVLNPPKISYQTPQVYTVNTGITPLVPTNTGGAVPPNVFGLVTTLAGNGATGATDGSGIAASFNKPRGIAVDANGNVYVADNANNKIRKITPTGLVSTFAGSGAPGAVNGSGVNASFSNPGGLAVDALGNVYIADAGNQLIRKSSPNGDITTFAGSGFVGYNDGTTLAGFDFPNDVVVDNAGNVYVSDYVNEEIRKITPGGVVSTLAGYPVIGSVNGTGSAARFYHPGGMVLNAAGNIIVTDNDNSLIRTVTPTGIVTTLAGDGTKGSNNGAASASNFNYPSGVAIDASGNLYISDTFNSLIRKVDPSGNVTTFAGSAGVTGFTNGDRLAATFNDPFSVVVDNAGDLYVSDGGNNAIRKIALTGYDIDKPLPSGLVFDKTTGIISGTPTVTSPATNYTVTAYNTAGSSATVVNIQVVSAAFLFPAITDKTICSIDFDPGATNGSGPFTYTSSNTAVATIVAGKIHIVGAGTSTITANDGSGPQTQILTVDPPVVPSVTISPDYFDGCKGMQATYTAVAVNGGTNPTYQWKVNGVAAGTNSNTFASSILNTNDVITCTLTNNSDCATGPVTSNNASLSADPYVSPTINISSSATGPVSAGSAITFTAATTNAGTDPIYQWQVNGINAGTNSPTFTNSCFNNNDAVSCTLTNQGGKCLTTLQATSNQITVSITDALQLTVAITASVNNVAATTPITFTAVANNNVSKYQWQVNGVNVGSNSPFFTSTTLNNGDIVTCNVIAEGGCNVSATSNQVVMIIIPPSSITIPNAFTPNGDGINDLWNIANLTYFPNCSVNIYNRYGILLYHSVGYGKAWDGTYNGSKLPSATYYYLINLGVSNKKLSGYVTLIR